MNFISGGGWKTEHEDTRVDADEAVLFRYSFLGKNDGTFCISGHGVHGTDIYSQADIQHEGYLTWVYD